MSIQKIYCKQGGLMEDPDFHWEFLGEAEGNSLRECCENLQKINKNFKPHYHDDPFYGATGIITVYGWQIGFAQDVIDDVLGKAIRDCRFGM